MYKVKAMSPLATWDEDLSDMNSAASDTGLEQREHMKPPRLLSPITLQRSSPTSPKSFPFYVHKKQQPKNMATNSLDIIEDARKAALIAAGLASRGIILQCGGGLDDGSTFQHPHPPSIVSSSSSSHDAITSVTGTSHESFHNNENILSSKHVISGKTKSDGSVTIIDKKKNNKKKNGAKKLFVLAAKFGLTSTSTNNTTSNGKPVILKKNVVERVTQGLWMCNLCGMTFTSLQSSEEHEQMCITMACLNKNNHNMLFDPSIVLVHNHNNESDAIVLKDDVRTLMCMSDQSVCKVITAAKQYVLTLDEIDSERQLSMLARDCAYYHHIERRAEIRREQSSRWKEMIAVGATPTSRPARFVSSVKTRLSEAYELIKEGESKSDRRDHYDSRNRSTTGERDYITHTNGTCFLNVLVKNSAQVVKNELRRLAKKRWSKEEEEEELSNTNNNPFAKFRKNAQNYVVTLASLALVTDFNARRIAVQTSNDFYRLLVPELKRRGVRIETDIEYRAGAFFVLAINILSIDWIRFIEYTHNDFISRQNRMYLLRAAARTTTTTSATSIGKTRRNSTIDRQPKKWRYLDFYKKNPTLLDAYGFVIGLLYYIHWVISIPICYFWYFVFLRRHIDLFICQSVVDDLYRYVESKGMEMNLNVKQSSDQASFMLAMLREMRADERRQKKEKDQADGKPFLGDLLGPHIKEDKNPASPPPDFKAPENLEYVCLEIDVPVGIRRLRWALLRSDSEFLTNAVSKVEERCQNIVTGPWSKHDDLIGMPNVADGVYNDFIGATREEQKLIPANAMVKANTCYTTIEVIEYNNHCFAYKSKTRTPEVPFGSSFFCWTQVVVYDLGKENCHIICSSGAEFPNSRPMVARQIESGIRSGTTESYVRLGETICRYA